MSDILYKTNMSKGRSVVQDFQVKRFKMVKNPTLSFFGPLEDTLRVTYWQSHAYDLYEYGRIIDTESFVARAFNKKITLMFKAGYSVSSENEKNAKYIAQRLNEIGYVTGQPFDMFLKETATNLITFHNAYLVKIRNQNASSGNRVKRGAVEVDPIAGYFNIAPETVQVKIDKSGKVMKYRQYVSASRYVEYSAQDVIHLHFNKRTGFLMGTPPLEPVKDDILALRRIEESIETLIYKSLFPIIHVKVGTDKNPAKKFPDGTSEVDIATQHLRHIEDDGGIVTDQKVEIKAIGAESLALRVEGYLGHFKERVFIGLGMSGIDFGIGDSTGRATGEVLSESLKESVMAYQDSFKNYITEFIFKELLVESGKYKNMYSIPDADLVTFEFNDLDIGSRIKIESHELNKMTQGAQGIHETRSRLKLKPVNDNELKKMQQQLQYDPNAEMTNETAKIGAKASAASKTTAAKKKAAGSSNTTKSIAKPKNQHSDIATGIISILDSGSTMKAARLYNFIKYNVIDTDNDHVINDNKIISYCKTLLNMYNTVDKNNLSNIISNDILNLILETMGD